MKKSKIVLAVIAVILATIVVASIIYVNDYYHAQISDDAGIPQEISIETTDNLIAVCPENPVAGFVFYPGAKVEAVSYEPLMIQLAKRNIMCVIVEMPGNLAMLDMDAAEQVIEKYQDIEDWYIGGHSLGGAMAALYAGDNPDLFKGLILMAAYSTKDLTQSGLRVLSVYGSEDTVLDKQNYDEYMVNYPQDFTELCIEGGCHSYFGNYGEQQGDGDPFITRDNQQIQTANRISAWMSQN